MAIFFLSLGQPGMFCSWYLQKDKMFHFTSSPASAWSWQLTSSSSFSFNLPLLPPPTACLSHLVHLPRHPPPHWIPEFPSKILSVDCSEGKLIFWVMISKKKLITMNGKQKCWRQLWKKKCIEFTKWTSENKTYSSYAACICCSFHPPIDCPLLDLFLAFFSLSSFEVFLPLPLIYKNCTSIFIIVYILMVQFIIVDKL